MDAQVPLWAAVLVGVVGAALGFAGTVVTGVITRRGARETDARERSRSNRDLIKTALPLLRSRDPRTQQQGLQILDEVSRMPDLDPADAALLDEVTQPLIESTLTEAESFEGTTGRQVAFDVVDDEEEDA